MKVLMKALAAMLLCASCLYAAGASAAETTAVPGGLVPADSKLLIVFANPGEGKEAEFNTYYDQHMREFMNLPNFVRVQKFKMAPRKARKPDPEYKYVLIFEFKGDQDESFARIQEWLKDGRIGVAPAGLVAKLDGMNYAADGAGYKAVRK